MKKNRIDELRREIVQLEEKIRLHGPCYCSEIWKLRKELEETQKALERQEQELVKEVWT